MKILICTGIYPPKIGGPAQYAKNMQDIWLSLGHRVVVKTYGIENQLPTGVRHIWYFFKILPSLVTSDFIFTLDTYSVGFPAVLASKIFNKKIIIRTGGDFLWEGYVERTAKTVLLRNFYLSEKDFLNLKEKIIFKITKWTLKNTSKLVFSTDWQRNIFIEAYGVKEENSLVIENYYGKKESDLDPQDKTFVSSNRKLVGKNTDLLIRIFERIKTKNPDVNLFTKNLPFELFMDKVKDSYVVLQISIGDISPNMILDAIRFNRPFICTREVGIYDRIKDAGVFIDPLNEEEIERAILNLLDPNEYRKARDKVKNFNFTHTWEQIAQEFIGLYNSIK